MSDSRRLKKVTFDQEQLYGGVPAQDFLRQMADFLPADAKLVGFDREFNRAELFMVFWSASYDEVDQGCYLPEMTLTVKHNYAYAGPGTTPVKCLCNADYTGLPHGKTCPIGQRR